MPPRGSGRGSVRSRRAASPAAGVGSTSGGGRRRLRCEPSNERRRPLRAHTPTRSSDARSRPSEALTGDKATKREGERQERKGEVKSHIDDAAKKAQDATDNVKDKLKDAADKA